MLKLLIVEDEMWIRLGFESIIDWKSKQIELVPSAENGEVAVERIRQYEPDIVITDIRMPQMDGLELMKWIRENKLNIAVMILSGFGEFEYAQQAMRYGAVSYLLKPVEEEELDRELERCREYLRLHRMAQSEEQTRNMQQSVEIRPIVSQAVEYIQAHLREENLSLKEIAAALFVNPTYLSHSFTKDLSVNLTEYIMQQRVNKAKEYLQDNRYSMTEIAEAVGYSNAHYFGQIFKRITKISPNHYRSAFLKNKNND